MISDDEYLKQLFDDLSERKEFRHKGYEKIKKSIKFECLDSFGSENIGRKQFNRDYVELAISDTVDVAGRMVFDNFIKELMLKDKIITILQNKFKKIMSADTGSMEQ